jgi:DNA-binding NarL/FixJ family response regulator
VATRILLCDDHGILRQGLKNLLEQKAGLRVVGEAADGPSAVAGAQALGPDVVIMDISLPKLNGIEATRRILAARPEVKVIILSMHSDRRFVREALKVGAAGYLLKDSAFEELLSAVAAVLEGRNYLSPAIAHIVVEHSLGRVPASDWAAFTVLTPREREVLQLFAEGRSTKQIALHLGLSPKTVETHRMQMMKKLHIHNIAGLTKYAIQEGLVSL